MGVSEVSSPSLNLAKQWIIVCNSHNQECQRTASEFIPSRLVDVGVGEDSDPQLCLCNDVAPGESYLTLSHCWGQLSYERRLSTKISAMLETTIPFNNFVKDRPGVNTRRGILRGEIPLG